MFNLDKASPGIARDNRGKNIYVDGDMNYEQFHKKYVEGDTEYSFKEKAWRNRHSDRKKFENYRKLLDDDIPKSFDDFQKIKYNKGDNYAKVKGFYKYKKSNPNSSQICYEIYTELKNLGINKGNVLLPNRENAYILPDSDAKIDTNHIMKRMNERNITDDEVRKFHKDADVQFNKWKGKRESYYTENGVSVVANTREGIRIYKTTWKKEDLDEDTNKILEVISNYANRK